MWDGSESIDSHSKCLTLIGLHPARVKYSSRHSSLYGSFIAAVAHTDTLGVFVYPAVGKSGLKASTGYTFPLPDAVMLTLTHPTTLISATNLLW